MKIIKKDPKENWSLDTLLNQLNTFEPSELVLISKDQYFIQENEEQVERLYDKSFADIIFPASADFPFPVVGINLYYWKYYPRERDTYHYLYSGVFLGKVKALVQYFDEMVKAYGKTKLEEALSGKTDEVDTFHRYYLDVVFRLEHSKLKLALDRNQKIFGNPDGRRSVIKWPIVSLRHGFIFYRYEKDRLKDRMIGRNTWDLIKRSGKVYNKRMKQTPAILIESDFKKARIGDVVVSFIEYLHSWVTIVKMWIYNGGKRKDHEIFRFRHNQNQEIKENIEKLIGFLESGKAFSFTHFNDGEMTFIKKFQDQDHKEVWFGSFFGRIQEKYNKQLGELLKAAFLKRQDYYYIGIPCQISHPKLSAYAKELRPVDEFTIPAMTFHHNLSKYPRILGALRNRKVYFIVNVNQDLTFFKKMGFEFSDDQIIRVPFRNAHEEYDNLKDRSFEDESVVLLMSGMLAKILCAYWFEHNPNTTFIAFGSSFDDYIQSKINFNLYPKNFPFSKTLIGSRSYLFGYKKKCKGCYDMSEPNPGN